MMVPDSGSGTLPGYAVGMILFLAVLAVLIRVRLLVGIVLALLWTGSLAFETRGTHSAALFNAMFGVWLVLRVRRFVLRYKARRDGEGYNDDDDDE